MTCTLTPLYTSVMLANYVIYTLCASVTAFAVTTHVVSEMELVCYTFLGLDWVFAAVAAFWNMFLHLLALFLLQSHTVSVLSMLRG